MATNREPPPLVDEPLGRNEDDDPDEDLFQSALAAPSTDKVASTDATEIEDKEDIFTDADEVPLDSPEETIEPKEKLLNGEDDVHKSCSDEAKDPLPSSMVTGIAGAVGNQELDGASGDTYKKPVSVPEADEIRIDPSHYIEITVTDPQKMGDGMGAYMAYRVKTKTNIPQFLLKDFSVLRRFSDFLGLHSTLHAKHAHLGRVVPPAPEKSIMGMTKVKMSKDDPVADEFVGRRRAALERYLNRTAQHPVLLNDEVFKAFLEKDGELPKATGTAALSGAGMMRLFSKVGESVNKMTYKMDESDQWFEEKQVQIENLDQQLRKVHVAVEALVQHRRELSQHAGLFAKSTAMLGNTEEHTSLSRALSQLAELEEKVEQVHSSEADYDLYLFSELLKDYITLITAIKEVFYERVKVFHQWQIEKGMLAKKRENEARLQLQGKTDKIKQAKAEVEEYDEKVMKGEQEFDAISRTIRKEMQRFDENRVKDFKTTLVKYLEEHMEQQQSIIQYWESFLPEAEAISIK